MNSSTPATWRGLGESLSERYARSTWRLPLVCIALALAVFVPLYLVRGVRLVRLGAAALVALAGGAMLFAHPFPALTLALFVLHSGLDFFLPGPVGAAILAVVLARIAFDRWPPRAGSWVDWGTTPFRIAFAALVASAVTSLLVVWRFDNAWLEVRASVFGIGLFIAITCLVDRPGRLAIMLFVLALATGVQAMPLLRAVLSPGGLALVAIAPEARFGGIGTDANTLATAANCVLPALCVILARMHGWRRLALVPLLLLLVGQILLSHSRAGMLILGMLALLLLGRWVRRHPWVLAVVVAIVVACVVWLPSVYWIRFTSIGQLGGIVVDRSLLLRTHLLEGAWRMFLDHPWIGVGLGNFRNEAPHFILGSWVAHNAYLEVAASLGIPGITSYLVLLASGLGMAWGAAKRWGNAGAASDRMLALSVVIGLLVFYLSAMTLSIHFHIVLWVLLALANAARRCAASAVGG